MWIESQCVIEIRPVHMLSDVSLPNAETVPVDMTVLALTFEKVASSADLY